jgi:hypothetical protein
MSIVLVLVGLVLVLILVLVGLVFVLILVLIGLVLVLVLISLSTTLSGRGARSYRCWSRPYIGWRRNRLVYGLGRKHVKRPHLLLLYASIFGTSSSTIAWPSGISFSPFAPNLNLGRSEFFRRLGVNLLGHVPIAGEWHPDDVLYAKQPFLGYKIPLIYLLALL